MKDSESSDKIEILPALKFIGLVAVFIAVLVFVLNIINSKRNKQIVDTYTQETNTYIDKNRVGLKILFSDIFAKSQTCQLKETISERDLCMSEVQQNLYKNISNDMKNFSSTMFVRIDPQTGQIYAMSLNGYARIFNSPLNEREMELNKLLKGEKAEIKWDDYFYELQDKEVVVPVQIEGKVVGGIVRGVIQ